MSSEIEAFGVEKPFIVQAISTRGTDLSAKIKRLTERRAEEGSTAFKVTGFGGNQSGGGSVDSRR